MFALTNAFLKYWDLFANNVLSIENPMVFRYFSINTAVVRVFLFVKECVCQIYHHTNIQFFDNYLQVQADSYLALNFLLMIAKIRIFMEKLILK